MQELKTDSDILFFDARDLFLGIGDFQGMRDVSLALRQMGRCNHPEAQYIYELFVSYRDSTKAKLKHLLKMKAHLLKTPSAVTLCYAGIIAGFDEPLLRQSACAGYAYAESILALYTREDESFSLAQSAAAQNDRRGLYLLGDHHFYGWKCPRDNQKAAEFYKRSAFLGCGSAMVEYAYLSFKVNDPALYLWLGRAARRNNIVPFRDAMRRRLIEFEAGLCSKEIIIEIGRQMKGQLNLGEGRGFGQWWSDDSVQAATRVIQLYDQFTNSNRDQDMPTWNL